MKSQYQKRREAVARAKKYSYNQSRAKRRGVSLDKWKEANEAYIHRLEGTLNG